MKVFFTLLASIFCINAMAQLPTTASANLSLWLKADAGVTLGSGSTVTQWADQSGNSKNAITSGVTLPTYLVPGIGNKPAIRFTDDRLETPLIDLTATNAVEVFMVYKSLDNTLSLPLEFGDDINASTTGFYVSNNETSCGGCIGGVNAALKGDIGYNYNAAPQPSTNFKILNTSLNKSLATEEVKIWINNQLQPKAAGTTNDDNTNNFGNHKLFIGRRNCASCLPTTGEFYIAEIILYNRTLTTTEKNTVYNYLNLKYAQSFGETIGVFKQPALWLKADAGVTTSGPSVAHWADQSGNGYDVNQTNVAAQPQVLTTPYYYNGKPAIYFDGMDFLNNITTNPVTGGAERTIFVIGNAACPGPSRFMPITFRWPFTLSAYTMDSYGGAVTYIYTDAVNTVNNTYIPLSYLGKIQNNPTLFTYYHGANRKVGFRLNKEEIAVTQSATVSLETGTAVSFIVGKRENAITTTGQIAEIIVYDSKLTATEITAVENYLGVKYLPPAASISTNKPVTVTSTNGTNVASNINDNDACTPWTATSLTAQSATINLQAPITVSSVFLNVAGVSSSVLTNAVIETSPNNTVWTTAATFSGSYTNFDNVFLSFAPVTNVQYVRVRMPTASVSFPSFGEFIVNPDFINKGLPNMTPTILNASGTPFGNTVVFGQTLYAPKAISYVWRRNGFIIPGANSQSYTITGYGNYTVQVGYSINCVNCNTALVSDAVSNTFIPTTTPSCTALFDGVNSNIRTPSNSLINPTAAFTYEAWFKSNPTFGSTNLISQGLSTTNASMRVSNNGVILANFYTGTSQKSLSTATGGFNDGSWHHVAFTYDGAFIKIYVDGYVEASLAATGAFPTFTSTEDFLIGKQGSSSYFVGNIDEVKVWNTARTLAEINSTLYTPLVGNEAGLLAYYDFNDNAYNGVGQFVTNKCNNTGAILNGYTEGNANYPQFSCPNINLPDGTAPTTCNLILNGTSSVSMSNTGTLTPTGTMSFWVKPSNTTNISYPLSLGTTSNNFINFYLSGNNFQTIVGGTATTITTLTQNEWHQLALTWDVAANKIKVYADGRLYKIISNTVWPTGNLNLFINRASNGNGYTQNMDDVTLYSTEKTFTEIQQMYLGAPVNTADASLLAFYNFETNTVNGNGITINNQAPVGGLNGTTVGTCGYPKFSCVLDAAVSTYQPAKATSNTANLFPSFGNDANACTDWTATTTNASWTVDLQTSTAINNIILIKKLTAGAVWATGSKIEASADNTNWELITELPTTANQSYENFVYEIPYPLEDMRYVRYSGVHASSLVGLAELLVNQNLKNELVIGMTPILLNTDGSIRTGQISVGDTLYSSNATTYQWKRNGVNISGATNQMYIVNTVGNYAVTVTYACNNNCNSNLSTTIIPSTLPPSAIPDCGLIQNGTAAGVRITHNALLNPTTAFTYEAWFKAETNVTTARKIIAKGAVAGYSVALGLQASTGRIVGDFIIGGVAKSIVSVSAYNDNAWHHVACTYNGTTITLYIDGQPDATLAATGSVAANSSDMEIGRNTNAAGTEPFLGTIDEIRIWNVARTNAELLAAVGSELVGNEAGLQAYYHFNNVLFKGQNRAITNNCTTTGIALNGISFGTSATPSFSCATPAFTEPDCNINLTTLGDIVTVPHNAVLNVNQFSVAAYTKTNQAAAADIAIISKENATVQNYKLSINNGKARISFNSTEFVEGTTNINDNIWHYIVGTYDGATIKMYVDGTLQASFASTATAATNTDNVIIGQSYTGSNQYIGKLDQISIWNRALTAVEINSYIGYNLLGTEIGLRAYYNFNDNPTSGTGKTVPNKCTATGAVINGTSAGTATTPDFSCAEVFLNTPTCSIMLNGKDNGISTAALSSFNTSQNFSIEMILKPNINEFAGPPPYVTNTGTLKLGRMAMTASAAIYAGSNGSGLNISVATNGIAVWEQNGFYNHNGKLSYSQPIKDWIHLAVTCTNNTLKLFVNGKQVSSRARSTVVYNIFSVFGYGFAGNIAEIRLWDRTLSGTEVHDNVNTTYTGSEVGLKSLYRFANNTLNGKNRTITGLGPIGAAAPLITRSNNTQTPMFTCANYVANTIDEAAQKPGSGNVYNNSTAGNASLNSWGAMSNTGTISMWVKAKNITPTTQGIFSTAPLSGNVKGNKGLRLELDGNGYIYVNFGDDNSTTAATTNRFGITTAPVEVNRWYHVAITWNKTTNTWSSIVNGIATQTNVPNTKWPTSFTDVNVGMGFDYGANNFGQGQVDELVHYNTILTTTEIRERMAKKLTTTDALWPTVKNYYRFDHTGAGNYGTGTSAVYDYKGTKHGMIYVLNNFLASSAPIGDTSAYDYAGVGSSASVSFGTTGKDTIAATVTAGTNVQGVHVYGVKEKPNTQTGQKILTDNNRYGGVFVIGDGNQENYNTTYSFDINPYIVGKTKSQLLLYKRSNNAGITWALETNSNIDTVTKRYTTTGSNAEFMLGYSLVPVRPYLGPDTTVYIICNNNTYNLPPLYATTTVGLTTTWSTVTPVTAALGTYSLIATSSYGFKDTAYATVAQDVHVWTGAVSNDWHNVNNWNIAKLPTAITHVIIPISTPNPCLISTADAFAASMQVQAAGNFDIVSPYKLIISGKCVTLPVGP